MSFSKSAFLSGTGVRMRTLRRRLGYTALEMSRRMGVSVGGYRKYEYGETLPAPVNLNRLSTEFGISMDWFLFDRGPMYLDPETQEPGSSGLPDPATGKTNGHGLKKLKPELRDMISHMEQDPKLYHQLLMNFHGYLQDKAGKKTG